MAVLDSATISAVLTKRHADQIANQIQRQVVLAQLLEIKQERGPSIQWGVRLGTAVGSTIADGADVSTFNSDTKIPAILQYGIYNDAFGVTGLAAASARASGEPSEVANLFVSELAESAERLAKKIGTDMYTGAGTSGILHGLTATAGPLSDSGTYAGIARGTYSQWESNVVDGIDLTFSLDLMRSVRRAIINASSMRPDLIICSPEVHDLYGGLLDSNRRHTDTVTLRGNTIKLDGGYQVLEFEGTPVVEDVDCPANTMLFLNTRFLCLSQLASESNQFNGSMGNMALAGSPTDRFGASSLPVSARINALARGGDAYKFQLIAYLQLKCSRPNSMGQLINIGQVT